MGNAAFDLGGPGRMSSWKARVCAWCPTPPPKPGRQARVDESASHGICRACLAERLRARPTFSRAIAGRMRSALA